MKRKSRLMSLFMSFVMATFFSGKAKAQEDAEKLLPPQTTEP